MLQKKFQNILLQRYSKYEKNKILCKIKFELDKRDVDRWQKIARPNQLLPKSNWSVWMILAGRGFGKTRAAAEAVRLWGRLGKYKRIALIANTIDEAQKVMIEGESGLLSICTKGENVKYYPSKGLVKWPNGAIANVFSAENYEKIRGFQFDAVWIDEFAKFKYYREVFDQVSLSLRLSRDSKMIITTTPRPLKFLKELIERKNVVTTFGSSFENQQNLSKPFLEYLESLKNTRFGRQEIFAEITENFSSQFWNEDDIVHKDANILFKEVIIAIDPAMSFNKNSSNETGIIVVGMDYLNFGYVIDDLSTRNPPELWAEELYEKCVQYKVKKVVIESNSGGVFVKKIIENIFCKKRFHNDYDALDVVFKQVYAKVSKEARALDIALLYQKKRIIHLKKFCELEGQMLNFPNGYRKNKFCNELERVGEYGNAGCNDFNVDAICSDSNFNINADSCDDGMFCDACDEMSSEFADENDCKRIQLSGKNSKSPDRIDALVWGLKELFGEERNCLPACYGIEIKK